MERLKGPFYLVCAFTLAGTSVISARFVSEELGTFTITAASLFFALLFLLPLCFSRIVKTVRRMSASDFAMLSLQGLCGIFLFRMFLLKGLLHTSAGEAGILTGATPAITAILAWVALQEPVSRKTLVGIISTVGGVLLIQGLGVSGSRFTIEHLWGNLLILCAAASESLFNILSRLAIVKKVAHRIEPTSPMAQTTMVTAIVLFISLIFSWYEQPITALAKLELKGWLALFWYGVFVTALAFICWFAGIERCNASTAAAFSGMMPFTSLLLSTLVLGEHTGWRQWSGGILVIIGMISIGSSSVTDKRMVLEKTNIQEKEQGI